MFGVTITKDYAEGKKQGLKYVYRIEGGSRMYPCYTTSKKIAIHAAARALFGDIIWRLRRVQICV